MLACIFLHFKNKHKYKGKNMKQNSLFVRSDVDAALGVFFDGFSKIIVLTAILGGTMSMPSDIIYGKIMPGIGLSTALLYIFTYWQAKQLNKAELRNNVTALPTGPQSSRIFVWLFAIMGPVFWTTGDSILAWQVGLAASFVGAFIYIIGGLAAPYLVKVIPTGALFGALAGGALTWLTLMPLPDMFVLPIVGFVSLFVLLVLYFANIEVKIPAALIAITLGTIVAWLTGAMDINELKSSTQSLGLSIPSLYFGFLNQEVFKIMMGFLPIIIVFSFGEAITTLQSIEQAREGGDNFDIKQTLMVCGLANLLASIIGSPFALGGYWGHTAWKKINAGSGYPLITAAMYLTFCFLGIVAILGAIIPAQATLGLLVFIGVASAGNAFEVTPKKYFAVTSLTMAIPILELIKNKMTDMTRPLENLDLTGTLETTKEIIANINVPDAINLMGSGAAFTALIWGSIFCFVIDRKWFGAAIASLVGFLLTFTGVIHMGTIIATTKAATMTAYISHPMTLAYLTAAIAFLILIRIPLFKKQG